MLNSLLKTLYSQSMFQFIRLSRKNIYELLAIYRRYLSYASEEK